MPITIDNVSFRYGGGPWVLRNAQLTIDEGETVAFVGPSGSGKTTMLNLIGGLCRPTEGTISREPTTGTRPWEPAWVMQAPLVFGRRSVLENVAAGLLHTGMPATARRERARRMIHRLGLSDVESRPAHTLSGGQLQRVSIARSLLSKPKLVLADEPTGELDRRTTNLVVDAMMAARAPEAVYVFATHDDAVARRCDRRITIENGRAEEVT